MSGRAQLAASAVPRDPSDQATTIAEFPKNARETVRVSLEDYRGTPCISVRVFYRDDAGDLRPGRSGISMAARHLDRLTDALIAARDRAQELGLLADVQDG
jgi:hypothetical protein